MPRPLRRRARGRASAGRRSALASVSLATALLSAAGAAQDASHPPVDDSDELVRAGLVDVLEQRLGASTEPQDLARLARAHANHADAQSDAAERQAAFQRAAKRYEDWIASLERLPPEPPQRRTVELAAARVELAGMILSRWAALELRDFDISGGRVADRERLAELLNRTAALCSRALDALQPLTAPLESGDLKHEQELLVQGVYDLLWRTQSEARFYAAWAWTHLAALGGADAPRHVRRGEELFRRLVNRSAEPQRDVYARAGLSMSLRLQNRTEEALAACAEALAKAEALQLEGPVRCELARVHQRAGRFQEARAVLKPLLAGASQDSPDTYYANLARVLTAESFFREAESLRPQAEDSPARAALLRKVQRLRADGLTICAELLARGGPWPELVRCYAADFGLGGEPSADATAPEVLLSAHLAAAEGNLPAAVRRLQTAAQRIDPTDPLAGEILFELARRRQETGDPRGAADAYLRLAQQQPGHPRSAEAAELACRLLAQAAEQSGDSADYARVVDAARLLIDRYPEHAGAESARWWLAVALEGAGRAGEAADAYARIPADSAHWEAAQFRGLMCRAAELERRRFELDETERRRRLEALSEEFERYAAAALERSKSRSDSAAAGPLAARARLEAARLRLLPELAQPERAWQLLRGIEQVTDARELGPALLVARLDALARLGRVEECLRLIEQCADVLQGEGDRAAALDQLAQAVSGELDRLESAEQDARSAQLARAARRVFERFLPGGSRPDAAATAAAPASEVEVLYARLLHLCGEDEAAEREISALLRREPSSGPLLRLRARILTQLAQKAGDAVLAGRARAAWEALLADPALETVAPERYWEARYHVLAMLLAEGRGELVAAAIAQDRVWRPEMGGPRWRAKLLALEEKAARRP